MEHLILMVCIDDDNDKKHSKKVLIYSLDMGRI